MIFLSYLSMLYIWIDVLHLCLASIAKFCDLRTWKRLKRWWGLEKRRRWRQSQAGRDNRRRDGGNGWWRDSGDRWGNVYGRKGVRIWWGRDGSAWRVACSCGIVSRFRVWARLWRLPCEWAGRKSETTVDRKRSPNGEGVTGRVSDAVAAAAYRTNPNLPDFIHPHGPLIHASGASAYEIFGRSSLMSCLPCKWRTPTGTMTRLLLH